MMCPGTSSIEDRGEEPTGAAPKRTGGSLAQVPARGAATKSLKKGPTPLTTVVSAFGGTATVVHSSTESMQSWPRQPFPSHTYATGSLANPPASPQRLNCRPRPRRSCCLDMLSSSDRSRHMRAAVPTRRTRRAAPIPDTGYARHVRRLCGATCFRHSG